MDREIRAKGERGRAGKGFDFSVVFWSLIMSQHSLINLINLSTLDRQHFLRNAFSVSAIINWFFSDIWSYILYFVL